MGMNMFSNETRLNDHDFDHFWQDYLYVRVCFFKKTTLTPGCLVMLSSSTDCRNLDSVEEEIEWDKNQTEHVLQLSRWAEWIFNVLKQVTLI